MPKNHNLEKAQDLFAQLINGEISSSQVPNHIKDIKKKLNDAHTKVRGMSPTQEPDVAELMPGKTTQEVQAMLDDATVFASKSLHIKKARMLITRMQSNGEAVYAPEPAHVYDEYKIPFVFEKADIPIEVFANGGRPSLDILQALVSDAEATLQTEIAARKANRIGRKR